MKNTYRENECGERATKALKTQVLPKLAKQVKTIIAVVMIFCLWQLGIASAFAGGEGVYGNSLMATMGTNDTVRVGLQYGANGTSSFKVICRDGFVLITMTGNVETGRVPMGSNAITVRWQGNGAVITDTNTGQAIGSMTSSDVIAPAVEGGVCEISGMKYRGGISVMPNKYGTMNVINILNLDQYTLGVLNAELNYSNPQEALKAQAIAARSYAKSAAFHGNSHTSEGFDVCASTHCQVYRGFTGETPETNAAVLGTAGLCMYYGNEPAVAYYHKNSGGMTQNVKDVWGSSLQYIKAVDDVYSPKYYWEKEYTFGELESKLAAAGKNIGALQSVEITNYTDNGAVQELTFNGTGGSVAYKGEYIRSLLGYSAIKSTVFAFNGTVVENQNAGGGGQVGIVESETQIGPQPAEETTRPAGSDGSIPIESLYTITAAGTSGLSKGLINKNTYVQGVNGAPQKIDLSGQSSGMGANKGFYVCSASSVFSAVDGSNPNKGGGNAGGNNNNAGSGNNRPNGSTGNSSTYSISGVSKAEGGSVKFTGLGYGHGVGMPQDSAVIMASRGFTYMDILNYYYSGIEIKNGLGF